MKGAFIEFTSIASLSAPNLVVFQFNPETLKHAWTQPKPAVGSNPLAVQSLPGESFSFTLALDATDAQAGTDVVAAADAELNGVSSRLAALEMLMFPVSTDNTLVDPSSGAGERRGVPAAQVPTVLFFWGPSRIVPVRVLSITVTEKLFDTTLHPTHADVAVEVRVLTPSEIKACTKPLKTIADAAYKYTQHLRVIHALANLNNAVGSIELPTDLGI
jgi:hypothetical protein